MITDLINSLPDEKAYLELLQKFEKVLKKYSRLLNYEDSFFDMQLFFFELVMSMKQKNISYTNDGAAVNYIITSIKHHYICLAKKLSFAREISFSDLSDGQLFLVEHAASSQNQFDLSDFLPLSGKLTNHEKEIIHKLLVEGYSAEELSKMYCVSRQAINQTKLRAIKKIREATQL